ncbi:MAG TPA: hypothetical protein VGS09_07930 [Actinomycetota bacterium]|nr:hypothetical protein [Actinomycetota bacterium]
MAAYLVGAGLLVGGVVAVTSAATGVLMCRFDTVGACHALVRTLAVRVGLVAGGMAVLMFLLVAGLMKMTAEDEERRELPDEAASVWGEPW